MAPGITRPLREKVDLTTLRRMKADGRKFAMLTAYDYPTAEAAEEAGVHSLLIGDSLGMVVLGQPTTRAVPLELMLILGEAVRRAAPQVYFVGDMPYEAVAAGEAAAVRAACRFRDEAGCDAVKFEAGEGQERLVEQFIAAGVETIAHLGLRPQTISSPDEYRAQARDQDSIDLLAASARRMVAAGASMLLLEAVPNEASQAVVAAVDVPVIGCGAGPACDGHVVVTHDMLGIGSQRRPRFVPHLANVGELTRAAMETWVRDIAEGRYPAPNHVYGLRRQERAPAKTAPQEPLGAPAGRGRRRVDGPRS